MLVAFGIYVRVMPLSDLSPAVATDGYIPLSELEMARTLKLSARLF